MVGDCFTVLAVPCGSVSLSAPPSDPGPAARVHGLARTWPRATWRDQGEATPLALESVFTAGGVPTVDVVRLERGWRIERLADRVAWRTGSGWGSMAATGRSSGQRNRRSATALDSS